jgi:hypothetical protein
MRCVVSFRPQPLHSLTKNPPEQEAGRAPESVWTQWKRKTFLALARNRTTNRVTSSQQPGHCTNSAFKAVLRNACRMPLLPREKIIWNGKCEMLVTVSLIMQENWPGCCVQKCCLALWKDGRTCSRSDIAASRWHLRQSPRCAQPSKSFHCLEPASGW